MPTTAAYTTAAEAIRKQDAIIGATVKVGLLDLRVAALRSDGVYELDSLDGQKFYDLTPWCGLVRVPNGFRVHRLRPGSDLDLARKAQEAVGICQK